VAVGPKWPAALGPARKEHYRFGFIQKF
jgi:hypothetical protein